MSDEQGSESRDVEISLAKPSETGAIAAVLLESFLEYKALYTEGGFAATTVTSREVLDRLQEGPV
jgi:hypothetical protein